MSFFGRKTAAVVGITPSDQYVPPRMALDHLDAHIVHYDVPPNYDPPIDPPPGVEMADVAWVPPKDRPMLIERIESYGSSSGSWIKIHLKKRHYDSDQSIDLDQLPADIHKALEAWLDGHS